MALHVIQIDPSTIPADQQLQFLRVEHTNPFQGNHHPESFQKRTTMFLNLRVLFEIGQPVDVNQQIGIRHARLAALWDQFLRDALALHDPFRL